MSQSLTSQMIDGVFPPKRRKLMLPSHYDAGAKACPACFRMSYNAVRVCPACEHVFYEKKVKPASR